MSSVTPLGFPNATELILRAGAVPHYLFASQLGGQSASPVEGTSISAGESTVTSVKTENWATNSADCHILDNQGFQLAQTEGSHLSVDRLALLASVASEPTFRSGSSTLRAAIAPNMSAYLSGPNSQSEALQTLHLMNPNFSGYGDSLNSANMVMFNPGSVAVGGGQESPLHNAEQQQHLSRFARSSAVNQTSYSHPSQMAAMSNVELGHQVASTDFYNKRPSNQGYSWGGGNEFSFLPSGHVTESNQEIGSHSNLVKSGQLSTPEFSHFGVGNLNSASYSQQAPLFSNSVATVHDMNMENLRQPSSAGQILSLSLSSQQPSVMQQLHSFSLQHHEPTANFFHGLSNTGSDNLSKENLFHSKCAASTAGGSFTIPTCGNVLGAAYSQMNPSDGRHMGLLTANFSAGSYGSKYLRPAQELLNEVVNVGQGLKGNPLKRSRSQSWMTGHSIGNDGSFMKSMSVSEPQNKSIISWGGGKEDEPIGSMPVSVSTAGNTESNVEPSVELSSADRQELQAKRAKLVGMRDEVDRRYKQYYHQMQAVATSFESVAGLGAAAAYTALALQTISKHFRCLRDAITGQIQATCKALGEEEVSGMTKGETSRLRFIDQQLRQQRALRQLGMMQQQAWRPQRGLPEHSVSILRAWLFEHFLHPYPKDADKIMLAKQTGLNRNQVSNWFINARVRLWKPMVEEMYLEETKEADTERANRSAGDNDEKGRNGDKQVTNIDATINESSKPFKQIKLSEESSQAANYSSDLLQGRIVTGSQADHLLLQEKDCIQQGSVKERPGSHDVSTLLGVDYKANKSDIKCGIEAENKDNRSDDSFKDAAYPVAAQNGSVQADQLNLAAYGSYQMNGMGRYSQENFGGTSYAANGDVFLTLGLQRCEGMPYSGGQQHYGAQNSSSHLLW